MKSYLVAGLVAASALSLSAAPAKTSKPSPLNERQMASVKGQGWLYVYQWNGTNYNLVYSQYIESMPRDEYQVSNGPMAGTYYHYPF